MDSTGSAPSEQSLSIGTMAQWTTVILEKEEEDGHHIFCPASPGRRTQSETIDEGGDKIRKAIELSVQTLTEDGLATPAEDVLTIPIEVPA